MKDILQVIQEADAKNAFVSAQDFDRLRKSMQNNAVRLDVVQALSKSKSRIIKKATTGLLSESSLWDKPNTERKMVACLRDCEIILRYITYALLAGDASVLDEYCLNGLQEAYLSLGVPITYVIRAVKLMKISTVALISNDDLATEASGYFDHVVISLGGEETQPLWKQLVALGGEVSEAEWAKLPSDLSRNFEHYMYGAPKEI